MSLLILSIIVQVALIIHVVKTGRNQIWIWVLALLSLPGAIAYIAVEILPELFRSRTAQRTARGLRKAMDPGAEASVRYAQLLQAQGRRAEAQKVARELLEQARIAPGHYRRAQRPWLDAAQRLL